jgi:ribosomal protein S27E
MCDCVGVVVDNSGRIKVTCQNCGNENAVPESLAGKEIQCPKCNNMVVAASGKKEPAYDTDDDFHKKSPKTPKKLEISEHGLIIIICVAAAVIVAGLIIIVAVRSGN